MLRQGRQYLQEAGSDGISPDGNQYDGTLVVTAASFTTAAYHIGSAAGYCLVLSCPSTGSPAGTVTIQGSCDLARAQTDKPDKYLTTWFDLSFVNPTTGAVSTSQALSGASTLAFEDSAPMYGWIRLVYSRSGGDITPTIRLQFKGQGG